MALKFIFFFALFGAAIAATFWGHVQRIDQRLNEGNRQAAIRSHNATKQLHDYRMK